jgi:hypothetical protein
MLQQAAKSENAKPRQRSGGSAHRAEAAPRVSAGGGPLQTAAAEPAHAGWALQPADGTRVAAWLCEDEATPEPGQVRRREFLAQLEARVRASVEAALASEGACTACPYIEFWFGHYRTQSTAHVERVLSRYAPGAARASSPAEALDLFSALAAEKARRWLATGRVDGLPTQLDASHVAAFAAMSELGEGHALDLGTRARFEPVLGRSLSHVRIHADARGDHAARGVHARAVAVGSHIAFRSGSFRPGTPEGDALLAHELVHTEQQRGHALGARPGATRAPETEADRHAGAAMARLWGDANDIGFPDAGPLTNTGLALRRCEDTEIDCGDRQTTVDGAFDAARARLATALERCGSTPPHANVAPALRGAFRTDTSRLPDVIAGLTAIQSELAASRTNYCPGRGPSCGPTMEGAIFAAFVRTRNEGQRGGPIYFCPTFFDAGHDRAGTVIHEAGHLSPGFYPDVTYWGRDNYNSFDTDALLRNADSYAVFVYWVVNGSAPASGGGAL